LTHEGAVEEKAGRGARLLASIWNCATGWPRRVAMGNAEEFVGDVEGENVGDVPRVPPDGRGWCEGIARGRGSWDAPWFIIGIGDLAGFAKGEGAGKALDLTAV